MPDSIATLEQQRSAILVRILDLGDFRSGSITPSQAAVVNPPAVAVNRTIRATRPTIA